MVLEFWFQNICLSQGSQPSQKENILQVKVCGVVTFATHPKKVCRVGTSATHPQQKFWNRTPTLPHRRSQVGNRIYPH